MDDGTEFGRYVSYAREQRGWTRTELLRRVSEQGVYLHATALKRIEDGEQVPKIHEAAALCRAFGVPVDSWSTSNRARFQLWVDGRLRDLRNLREALDRWEDGRATWPATHRAGEDPDEFAEVFRTAGTLAALRPDEIVSTWEARQEQEQLADDDMPEWWKWSNHNGPA
ncbi:helix-turn-helix domain-containing protein [Corynebacterium variabile]|nr:helix-turn-helix transcriptional regulator [Corynebacterium variabile]